MKIFFCSKNDPSRQNWAAIDMSRQLDKELVFQLWIAALLLSSTPISNSWKITSTMITQLTNKLFKRQENDFLTN